MRKLCKMKYLINALLPILILLILYFRTNKFQETPLIVSSIFLFSLKVENILSNKTIIKH